MCLRAYLENKIKKIMLLFRTVLYIFLKAKGFHDHPKPSTKSSATSLKRKGNVKSKSNAKNVARQLISDQIYKVRTHTSN
jgi:hypothetical protein